MKDYIQKNPGMSFVALIVAIIAAAALVHSMNNENAAPAAPSSDMNVPSTSTDMTASSTPEATVTGATLAYSVFIASSTYSQNQIIPITVSVLNLTDASTTLSFKNGCMGDYALGGFDMAAHTSCLPTPTSFVVAPHDIRQVQVVHYPSVFKLLPGNYTLTAFIIGYGGQSVPITITQ